MGLINTQASHKIPGGIPLEEEVEFYSEILDRVARNPRFYLDNLDELEVFSFSFLDYHQNRRKKANVYK